MGHFWLVMIMALNCVLLEMVVVGLNWCWNSVVSLIRWLWVESFWWFWVVVWVDFKFGDSWLIAVPLARDYVWISGTGLGFGGAFKFWLLGLDLNQWCCGLVSVVLERERERGNEKFFLEEEAKRDFLFYFIYLFEKHTHTYGRRDEIREYTHTPTLKQLVLRSKW